MKSRSWRGETVLIKCLTGMKS